MPRYSTTTLIPNRQNLENEFRYGSSQIIPPLPFTLHHQLIIGLVQDLSLQGV